ncbi:MAG: class I SAM-dependent methyltransferase [Chloroflexi bacterium]|nr:class I SAM-dependent methyltransferase [Chloroflexota bacterium]
MYITPPLNRTELINALITRIGARNYLEIGVNNGRSFSAIQCEHKIGVDPKPVNANIVGLTSDAFFAQNRETFDVIFIDGLHEAEQVHRDITNALAGLNDNDGGFIICHDMNPWSEKTQHVPYAGGSWTGDCWKAFVRLRTERGDLEMCVVNIDCGCAVIRRGSQKLLPVPAALDYRGLSRHRREWLNLVTAEEFDAWLQSDMRTPIIAQPAPSLWRATAQGIAMAAMLVALILVPYFVLDIMNGAQENWSLFGFCIAVGAVACTLTLPLTAAAAVRIGVYAAMPRRRTWIGSTITTAARVTALIPPLLIGLLFGKASIVGLLSIGDTVRESPGIFMGFFFAAMLLTCGVLLLPTIVHATIRSVLALPLSLREPRFHPAMTRGEFTHTVVLPNAMPTIVPGIGVAFGRICCDFGFLSLLTWLALNEAGFFEVLSYRKPYFDVMYIVTLIMNIAAWFLLQRVTRQAPRTIRT